MGGRFGACLGSAEARCMSPHPGGRGPPVGNNYPPVREGTVGPFRPRVGSRDWGPDSGHYQEAGGMAVVPAFRISKKMGQSGPCHWGRSRQGARFGGSRGGASGVPLGVVRALSSVRSRGSKLENWEGRREQELPLPEAYRLHGLRPAGGRGGAARGAGGAVLSASDCECVSQTVSACLRL